MTAFKNTTTVHGVIYQVPNGAGDLVSVHQGQPVVRSALPTIRLVSGGASMSLTQSNINDLLAALTSFASTGIVS
jgi:hypothetical protein